MKQTLVIPVIVILNSYFLISCTNISIRNHIEGTWINSEDETDTLVFINDSRFEARDSSSTNHWYSYSIKSKKIEIQYAGPNKIYVEPTMHDIIMAWGANETMSIDFSKPSCYGFPQSWISYYKID